MTFILPKSDDCFKELFRNEDVRKYFISDVTGIPLKDIKSIKLANPFLWKSYKRQKLGILDVFLELNNHTKINIEIQLKHLKNWDKRQLFYLSKIYSVDIKDGEDYDKLKPCISIAILDFDLSDRPEYHNIYKLRDKNGNIFSDMFEVHTIELKKPLIGNEPINDWIRFFNAESEEDFNMIKTKNPGILKAMEKVRNFSLNPHLRLRYEAYLKDRRDQHAIEAYIRDEGMEQGRMLGIEQGRVQGIEQGIEQSIDIFIRVSIRDRKSADTIIADLMEYYSLSEEKATSYYEKYSGQEKS